MFRQPGHASRLTDINADEFYQLHELGQGGIAILHPLHTGLAMGGQFGAELIPRDSLPADNEEPEIISHLPRRITQEQGRENLPQGQITRAANDDVIARRYRSGLGKMGVFSHDLKFFQGSQSSQGCISAV